MEEFFLEVIDQNLDSQANLSIYVDSTNQWIKGIKVLSLANDMLRYTYYEINMKEKNPQKRLIERLTPLEGILDIKIESTPKGNVKELNKDYEIEFEENYMEEDDDDGHFVPLD